MEAVWATAQQRASATTVQEVQTQEVQAFFRATLRDVAEPASDACGAAGRPVVVGMVAGDVAKPASVGSSNPAALSASL